MILIAFVMLIVSITGITLYSLKPKAAYYRRQGVNDPRSVALIGSSISLLVFIIFITVIINSTYKDIEILNGEVTSKHRVHDTYVRSYSCNCYTTCTSGKNSVCTEHCSTCYEDRFTVDWYLQSNIGRFDIDKLDRSSRRVYSSPDPRLYKNATVGMPCAKSNSYDNYLKNSNQSIFSKKQTPEHYKKILPEYPEIYDIYKVNRVINVNSKIPNIKEWNRLVDEASKIIGPKKKANLLFVFVDNVQQDYRYALEKHWNGGKKNDITVIIGTNGFDIQWTDVIMFADNIGNELTTAKIIDSIISESSLNTRIINNVKTIILQHFDKQTMERFKHVAEEEGYSAPTWAWAVYLIFLIIPNFLIQTKI